MSCLNMYCAMQYYSILCHLSIRPPWMSCRQLCSIIRRLPAYIGTFTHARTHAHAARPQVQAIPGAHPGMDMHNESLVTGHPNDGASARSP